MQEEITEKTIALTVQCAKITGRVLAKVMRKALRQMEKKRNTLHHGKQSIRQLSKHNAGLSSIH